MKLSDNLKSIRKEHNLSQEQLAEKLGVSRQAVSKWESGQSYPEMDKVLLICKLFNYNIDELMNENVKEVDETKQSKININKYIDDFFEYITKTVDLFSSMNFKQKFKCLMEQTIISICLFMIFIIIGAIAGSVVIGIFGKLSIYHIIRDILESIYIVFALVFGVTILLHIFKIRYLDYYEFVKEDNLGDKKELESDESQKLEISEEKSKIFIEKKKEKIVIRDPNHSQFNFLNGIFRVILWFIKFIAVCIASGFVFTFISLFCLLVLSFLFVKSGLIFIGALLCVISGIILNFIILELLYNFIISKKSKKTRMAISFIIALILAGISIGMILVGITNFNYVENTDVTNSIEDIYTFQMTENLSIDYWSGNIEYIEENSNDIKIVLKHSEFLEANLTNENDIIDIYFNQYNGKIMEGIKKTIDDINNKEIKNYYRPTMSVYASKENIEKLKQNKEIKNQVRIEEEINVLNNSIAEKEMEIIELQNELIEKENTINSLETEKLDFQNQLQEKDNIINSLEQQIIMNEY